MTPAEPPRDHPNDRHTEDSEMQPFTTDTHDPADLALDEQLRRTMLAGAGDAEELDFSRRVAAHALDDAIASEARRRSPRIRPRRLPALAAVGGLAAAVLVAGALAPGGGGGDGTRTTTTPFAPSDASAAEVLEGAAVRMLAAGAGVGEGPAWHAIAHDSFGGTWETWYDADRGEARWAMYQPPFDGEGMPDHMQPRTPMPSTYYVLDVEADGSATIRQYERRAGSTAWTPQPGGAQMDGNSMTGPGFASVEAESLVWLRAVDRAEEPSELRAANERFVERTTMWFAPPAQDPTLGDPDAAARAMQLLYLMRVAQLEPDAVAQLYRDVIDIDSLARLEDGEVDGRAVVRLQLFRPEVGPKGADQIASVLLLDKATGAPVGIEATDGTSRDVFEPARRTTSVGAEATSCGSGDLPPCALLRGEGPIVAAADRIARDVGAPIDPTPGAGDQGSVGNEPAAG